MKNEYLFLYGTLMGKFPGNPLHHELLLSGEYLEETTVSGSLYLIDSYPGYIPVGTGQVHGELWTIHRADYLFPILDSYEDVNLEQPSSGEYRRELVPVRTTQNTRVEAWIYIYQGSLEDKIKLESGYFL